ncbi:hypothetical protein GCM10010363_17490 [Streptomyces omiyaensis]|nr:hypothetical protein GCM10010363_17490 [Streptomyces omiyaensis]
MCNTVLNTVVIALTCGDALTAVMCAITCRNAVRGPSGTGLEGGPPITDDDHAERGAPRRRRADRGASGVRSLGELTLRPSDSLSRRAAARYRGAPSWPGPSGPRRSTARSKE